MKLKLPFFRNCKRLTLIFVLTAAACSTICHIYLKSNRVDVSPKLPRKQCHKFKNDNEGIPNKKNFYKDILKTHPMLAVDFLLDNKLGRKFNNSCAKFPSLFSIKINNRLWQHMRLSTGRDLYLFSAHLDNRKTVLETQTNKSNPVPVIRLIGMTDQSYKQPFKAMCQFWYKDEEKPTFSANVTYDYIWNFMYGYKENISIVGILITCPLVNINPFKIPQVASFVENKCDDATTALNIQRPEKDPIPEAPPKGTFAVCIKSMAFWYSDISYKLVEWIEMLRQLGAQKIYTYELALNPNVKKVLQYYENTGFVDNKPYTLPGSQNYSPELLSIYLRDITSILQMRCNELIPYNDCLYRNWYRYEYLAVIDTDEIIIPVREDVMTWDQLVSEVVNNASRKEEAPNSVPPFSSICGRAAHFVNNATDTVSNGLPDDIPTYFYMMTHLSRGPELEPRGFGAKCFHATSRVLTLHNHYAFKCVNDCKDTHLEPSVCRMNHYRFDCSIAPISRCQVNSEKNKTVIDTVVLKYKKPVIDHSNVVFRQLGML